MFNDEPDCGQVHSIYESETERKKCEPSLFLKRAAVFVQLEKRIGQTGRRLKRFLANFKTASEPAESGLCRTVDLHS